MRESRSSGSVRGAASDGRPYRELVSMAEATGSTRASLPVATSSDGRKAGPQIRDPLIVLLVDLPGAQ